MTQDAINAVIYQSATAVLSAILTRENIPHEVISLHGGFQIRFPWCYGDVVCHSFSYGNKWGEFESYGFPWDEEDVTVLSISDAVTKIIKYYHDTNPEGEKE